MITLHRPDNVQTRWTDLPDKVLPVLLALLELVTERRHHTSTSTSISTSLLFVWIQKISSHRVSFQLGSPGSIGGYASASNREYSIKNREYSIYFRASASFYAVSWQHGRRIICPRPCAKRRPQGDRISTAVASLITGNTRRIDSRIEFICIFICINYGPRVRDQKIWPWWIVCNTN